MNFSENITLDVYSQNAHKQFDEMQSRLSTISNSFQTRMDGKSTGGIIGSLIVTLLWLAAFIVSAIIARSYVNNTMLLIAVGIAVGLVIFMIIDTIMDFSYYGKISSYKHSIAELQTRVDVGKNSIKANHDSFLSSRTNGWNYTLNAANSIPDEATAIEATMAGMESVKKGFINGAKNAFFFATAIAITVVGSIALFPTGYSIVEGITGEYIPSDTMNVLNIIALIIVCVGVVLLAKLVWSKTDCNVTNTTVLISVIGPLAYLALVLVATVVVSLVILAVHLFLMVLAVVVAGAAIFASTSGG